MNKISIVLLLIIFVSAMSVVFVRSANRQSFLALQAATYERDRLSEEWGRLQLEHATWSLHDLIENEARRKLGMIAPDPGETVVLRLGSRL
jgi:cell division protein FtsL